MSGVLLSVCAAVVLGTDSSVCSNQVHHVPPLSLSLSQCQVDACQPFLKTTLQRFGWTESQCSWPYGTQHTSHPTCPTSCIPHTQPIASHTPRRRIPCHPPLHLALHVPHALFVTSHMPCQAMTAVVGEHDILQPPSAISGTTYTHAQKNSKV